jgi:hypothetical protein
MSVPMFISIYSNGDIWVSRQALLPTHPESQEASTLVTCLRVSSDASPQKIAVLTGSGNASASALAETLGKGTGASGSKHTQKELT